jgi:hypothetical protein
VTAAGSAGANPGNHGWVVITDQRHRNPAQALPGCPSHEAVFNDPLQTMAEYLAGSAAAAKAIYHARLAPMGLGRVRLRRHPELVQAELPAATSYVDQLAHAPVPLAPTPTTQQWGELWAAANYQGICTTLPVPCPAGTSNLWTCVFLHVATVVRVASSTPWNGR